MHTTTGTTEVHSGMVIESSRTAVSWPAVLAGAVVAMVATFILLMLGTGLGLTAASPWSGQGASAETLGIVGIAWLLVMHIFSGVTGGYVAGRLRTRWVNLHSDEVAFRDKAHGLLVWALSTLFMVWLMATAISSVVSGVAKTATTAVTASAGAAATAAATNAEAATAKDSASPVSPESYLMDTLFRTDEVSDVDSNAAARAEIARIFINSPLEMSAADRAYVARVIVARSGVDQAEAERRITEVQNQIKAKEIEARKAADAARKSAVTATVGLTILLLVGAFSASLAATVGGRFRDR